MVETKQSNIKLYSSTIFSDAIEKELKDNGEDGRVVEGDILLTPAQYREAINDKAQTR